MRHPASCTEFDHDNYNEYVRCEKRREALRLKRDNTRLRRSGRKIGEARRSSGVQLLLGENGFEGHEKRD